MIWANKNNPTRKEYIFSIIISAFFLLYIYTFLHESGHAIVGVLYGGKIQKFVIGLDAHVIISQANYTNFGLSLLNISGMLLPVIIYILFILFYRRTIQSLLYHCFYYISSIGVIGSILAWVIVPIISIVSSPPTGDDVAKFLKSSEFNPFIVSIGASLSILILIIIIYKKGVFSEYRAIVKKMNSVYK